MPKLVSDIGHIILQVGNMDEALRLYRDTLGFEPHLNDRCMGAQRRKASLNS